MKRHILFYGTIIICLFTASKCAMDHDYPLYLRNNSDQRVQFWTNRTGENEYPDTLLYHKPTGVTIPSNEKVDVAGGSISWEKIYQQVKTDTISFFIYNADTLDRYEWNIIKENYMILQRYDLSIYDLQKLDYTLYYPPTEAMRNMKMWPAYNQQ